MRNKLLNMKKMRNKLVIPIIILIISVVLAGCIYKPKEELLPEGYNKEVITINYIENRGPMITKQDFPDFQSVGHDYFISQENISLSLNSESVHGTYIINSSDEIPEGYRLFGGSEIYNASKRYILLQYKVFDQNESLSNSMDVTTNGYVEQGFRTKILNNSAYKDNITSKGRIILLELNDINTTNISTTDRSNTTNGSNTTRANIAPDMNVVIVLFGFDDIIGKIGVQDYKNRSLDESLAILDIVYDRLKIGTKQVKVDKIDTYGGSHDIGNKDDEVKN